MAKPSYVRQKGTTVLEGQYEIVKKVHGGMANSYIVKDNVGKFWFMKEVCRSQHIEKDKEYIAILQEGKVLSTLNYSGIPRILAMSEVGDTLILIEDYIEGPSLSDLIVQKNKETGETFVKPMNQATALNWFKQLVQIVIYLHSLKTPIFHRDIKPENIMIQKSDGSIKLIDFGTCIILKRNEYDGSIIEKYPEGWSLGTSGFAAPEQTSSKNICDLRSDIFALGRTLYNMLTGVNPHNLYEQAALKTSNGRPPKYMKLKPLSEYNIRICSDLQKIVEKCTAENPDDRYQDCKELYADLQQVDLSDGEFRRKAKKKVGISLILLALSIILIVGSFIPFFANKAENLREYKNAVLVAEQSGLVKDYDKALSLNALEIKPYFGLIEAIKSDGEYTIEEENVLLNYVNPNLSQLKQMNEYGRLAFEVGKLYWFYYPTDGTIRSVRWFKDALDKGYNTESSEVYYNIGIFDRDIKTSITEAEDAGMYIKYWDNLKQVQENNVGDIVTIQTKLALAECISVYTYSLKRDGVSYEDISSQVKMLERFVEDNEISDSGIEAVTNLMNQLKTIVSGLQSRVDKVYGVEGGH